MQYLPALLIVMLFHPAVAPAQTTAEIDQILTASEIRQVLEATESQFLNLAHAAAPSLDSSQKGRLASAAGDAYSVEAMYERVAGSLLAAAGETSVVEDLSGWLLGGVALRVRELTSGEPDETLAEFVNRMEADPPGRARVDAMIEFVRVQGAADFYILYEQALTEAARNGVRALDESIPPYEAPPEEQVLALGEQYFQGAVISFLHRFQDVSDADLAELTASYRTPSGQWFVESYTLSLHESILDAGERVRAQLSDER